MKVSCDDTHVYIRLWEHSRSHRFCCHARQIVSCVELHVKVSLRGTFRPVLETGTENGLPRTGSCNATLVIHNKQIRSKYRIKIAAAQHPTLLDPFCTECCFGLSCCAMFAAEHSGVEDEPSDPQELARGVYYTVHVVHVQHCTMCMYIIVCTLHDLF